MIVIGFAIIAYLLFDVATIAKIVGNVWLAAGLVALAFIKSPAME